MAEGVEYHVRAILEAAGGARSMTRFQKFATGMSKHSLRVQQAGQAIAGSTIQTAAMFGKIAAGTALLAGAAGFGALVTGGIKFNAQLEESRFRMASTLQLFKHAAGTFEQGMSKGLSAEKAAGAQFAENMRIATVAQDRIFRMAAKSPASFGEAEQMFANMLPGARAITGDMERIMQLQQKSLALGLITGDFSTTGAQLSRILTGGAGAEMETWRQVLATPIKDAAAEMGGEYAKLGTLMGEDLTKAFNKLAPEDRMKLVEKAMESLPTEELGKSFRGVASTIMSNAQILQKYLGEAAFAKIKDRMQKWVGKGGLLDPDGETMSKLATAATSIGNALGGVIDPLADKLEKWVTYLANNWPSVIEKFQKAWDTGLRVAKMILRVAAARALVGGGMMAAGGIGRGIGAGMGAGGKMFSGITKMITKIGPAMTGLGPALTSIGPAIMGISSAALFALPLFLVLGAALMGLGAMFGGVVAWFITNWDQITAAIQNGTLSLSPLFDALEQAWNGFAILGAHLLGGGNAATQMQTAVYMLTDAVHFMLATFVLGMKVVGAFQFATNAVILGVKAIGLALIGMIEGIMFLVNQVAQGMAKAHMIDAASAASVAGAYASVQSQRKGFVEGMRQDAKDATQVWDAADKLLEGQSTGKWAKGIEETMRNDKLGDIGTAGAAGGKPPTAPAGGNVNIHKMVVHQDLRNQDPDRVIGAFYRAVDKSVRNRTQSTKLQPGGI